MVVQGMGLGTIKAGSACGCGDKGHYSKGCSVFVALAGGDQEDAFTLYTLTTLPPDLTCPPHSTPPAPPACLPALALSSPHIRFTSPSFPPAAPSLAAPYQSLSGAAPRTRAQSTSCFSPALPLVSTTQCNAWHQRFKSVVVTNVCNQCLKMLRHLPFPVLSPAPEPFLKPPPYNLANLPL